MMLNLIERDDVERALDEQLAAEVPLAAFTLAPRGGGDTRCGRSWGNCPVGPYEHICGNDTGHGGGHCCMWCGASG